MHETPNRQETESVEMSMPEEKNDRTTAPPIKKSREPLLGAVLFAAMILFVLASIGGIGWVAYGKWQNSRMAENRPSISALPEKSEAEPAPQTAPDPNKAIPEQSAPQSDEAQKKLEISVLNGGGTKGSAGVLADLLKKEGYLKTDAGNTLNNYVGVTIYHAASLAKEAEAIKASIVKKYPQANILPADATNKETSASQITIIIGK